MRYPVRCCCDGSKLYGFLEIPTGREFEDGETVTVRAQPPQPAPLDFRISTIRDEFITLRRFRDLDNDVDEIAVYSDERPIEFWRSFRGFTELKPVMRFSVRTLARANRTAAADVESVANQVRRLQHPSVYLAMITVSRGLMEALLRVRDENSLYRGPADGNPPTFLGIEIEEDPSLPADQYEIFTNGETAVLKLAEIRRDAGLAEAIARGVRF